ncbi:DUF4910 domain-containing protein [Bosea sp. 117]|uniref:DUF4910 domain-containing protein n=1 Tax=Bosea sp. 117 TaxID=1125973 RepID=UPI0009DF7D7F|nr:DUF4910 domain-containing protein [Bosea sp. 117]
MRLTGSTPDRPLPSGEDIFATVAELYPICRSITGDGVRRTLDIIGRLIDVERHEVPTGTRLFDWIVPDEWNIREAHVTCVSSGERVIDFARSNLHLLGYSVQVRARLPLAALKEHLFSDPAHPDATPYRTSYYREAWGFCLPHRALLALPEGEYDVVVDSTLAPGSLTYGEYLHRGSGEAEVLLSAHICHPSLANDNCSGLALLAHFAATLRGRRTRYSYRFLFAPGTIGALAWLSANEPRLGRIRHGLVVSCVGDGGGPVYKKSRRGDAMIDRVMRHVLAAAGPDAEVMDFFPYGYDERQFCSPGFDLPVGLFQRSLFGRFPEYHSSADDLDLVRPEHLARSYALLAEAVDILERDRRPLNLFPKGEPQLGRRGLYAPTGGDPEAPARNMARLWVLNLADGRHSLLDMAERAGMRFTEIADAAETLARAGLIDDQASSSAREGQPRSRSDIIIGSKGQGIASVGSS